MVSTTTMAQKGMPLNAGNLGEQRLPLQLGREAAVLGSVGSMHSYSSIANALFRCRQLPGKYKQRTNERDKMKTRILTLGGTAGTIAVLALIITFMPKVHADGAASASSGSISVVVTAAPVAGSA